MPIYVLDIVVSHPHPVVLEIDTAPSLCNVHRHKGSNTILVQVSCSDSNSRRGRALGEAELGSGKTPDPGVNIPHARGKRSWGSKVLVAVRNYFTSRGFIRNHSNNMAPICCPCVETMKSESSTEPASPLLPTWRTGFGLAMELKKLPLLRMTE